MTAHASTNRFRLFLILTALLLLCGGLQAAFACPLPGNQNYSSAIRVDSCHLVVSQKESEPCCQIEVCHHSPQPQRDLDTPEYHTQHKGSHCLAHESNPLTPQLRVGQPFISHYIVLPQLASITKGSLEPLQSLYSLRTVVLLN